MFPRMLPDRVSHQNICDILAEARPDKSSKCESIAMRIGLPSLRSKSPTDHIEKMTLHNEQ